MPVRGEIVVIVRGRNNGRRGIYIKNVAFTSCMVLLENSTRPQRFLRTSVANAMTAAPPTPVATAVLLGGASPAQQQEQRTQHTQEIDTLFRQQRTQEIDTLFCQLSVILNSLEDLEGRLKDLLLEDT
jgi:hypothetical protein